MFYTENTCTLVSIYAIWISLIRALPPKRPRPPKCLRIYVESYFFGALMKSCLPSALVEVLKEIAQDWKATQNNIRRCFFA